MWGKRGHHIHMWSLKCLEWLVCGTVQRWGNGECLQGEIKLSVTIEDEANKDLPSAVQLFRPIRQYVYGVLFSLVEARKRAERLAARRNCLPECESCGPALSCHGRILYWGFYKVCQRRELVLTAQRFSCFSRSKSVPSAFLGNQSSCLLIFGTTPERSEPVTKRNQAGERFTECQCF